MLARVQGPPGVRDAPRRRRGEPARAVEARRVPALERRDLHGRAGVRRVDEAAAADVHADVPDAVEEDQVARLQRAPRDAAAAAELRVRAVRQLDPEVLVDEADEAGAVEAGARRGAAVA